MIKIENVEVVGLKAAIRGMRNPMNSWDKSDSYSPECTDVAHNSSNYIVGEKDLDLMRRLRKAGTDHRKFMRMITVYADVTAPLYWWKEYDTYKVGTVANSCSTMHKIQDKEFTIDDFSVEHLSDACDLPNGENPMKAMEQVIHCLNLCRYLYVKTKDKAYWWQMIQLLPSSFNQKRTLMLNYEVLTNMYHARKNHKLDEWRDFCEWIKTLPYSELIIGE